VITNREVKKAACIFGVLIATLIFFASKGISADAQNHTTYDIQRKLAEKGYQPGPADGAMGRKTKEALKHFQEDNKLPISGVLDNQTEIKLFGISADKEINTFDHIHQFQGFFEDSSICSNVYVESGFSYSDYDLGSLLGLGVRGGYPIAPKWEIDGAFNLLYADIDSGDSEFGISDLYIGGKYNLYNKEAKISAGGFLTLPTGSEDVGQSNFNLGVYGALRYRLDDKLVITGTTGIARIEDAWFDDEISFSLGGGCIYAHNEDLHFIGELLIRTGIEYMMVSGGLDYNLKNNNKFRGALGIGIDKGAPDYRLWLSYFFYPSI
jgi:peptidoglycan hydrolase-like protein with peptidoglycan-binding domain